MGIRITPDVIKNHFKSAGLSADHIRSLFNPEDKQDVKAAFDMLKDIWNLPCTPTGNHTPGFLAAREALWTLGKLLFHMVFPYLCVDLSLSEQIEHLSATVHLALGLYHLAGKDFLPTNLYIDLMIMVKNVYFCIAKAKVDDLSGEFWIILLGTDRLEELFGILRTMVGSDANLDILQLISRLAGTTEVSNILAKYPHWDRSPRRLKLSALLRESKEIPDSADHIKPASWKGNVYVQDVSLQTSWNRGQYIVEQECETLSSVLRKLNNTDGIEILAPFGTLLFDTPLGDDDIDESIDYPSSAETIDPPVPNIDVVNHANMHVEVEDALGDIDSVGINPLVGQNISQRIIESKVLVDGTLISKAQALLRYSKSRTHAGSTDRLRRVQDIP